MSETVMSDLFVEKWLLIVRKAKKFLTHSQYEDWKFIVGLSGSPAERAEIGEKALQQFLPSRLEGG